MSMFAMEPPALVQSYFTQAEAPQEVAEHGDYAPALLTTMATAYEHAIQRGRAPHEAMVEALQTLRFAEMPNNFTGPGKRRASQKAERRFRAMLDLVIAEGSRSDFA